MRDDPEKGEEGILYMNEKINHENNNECMRNKGTVLYMGILKMLMQILKLVFIGGKAYGFYSLMGWLISSHSYRLIYHNIRHLLYMQRFQGSQRMPHNRR